MLRRDQKVHAGFQQVLDALIIAASLWLAHLARASDVVIKSFGLPAIKDFEQYNWLCLLIAMVGPFALASQGFYEQPAYARRKSRLWPLFKGCVLNAIIVILALYVFRQCMARYVALLFGGISFLLIGLRMCLFEKGIIGQPAATRVRRVLLVGVGAEIQHIRKEIESQNTSHFKIAGVLDLNRESIKQLVQFLHDHSVNMVILNTRHTGFDVVEAAIHACELEGVEVLLMAEFIKTRLSRRSFDEFQGHPVVVFRTAPDQSWQSICKNVMDYFLSVLLIVLLSPLLLMVAALIKLTSPGPVLFRQQRAGLNGHPFTIYKFRTMVTDAERRQQELAAQNEMSGPVFKVTNDPRIIPIGRLLRKYSIDELPQLFNVARGEMSLVGPRPLPVDEVRRFDDMAHRRRLSVRPGLTCLWQISGRNKISDFTDWVRLDLEYIDNWSLWLDARILLRTVPAVLAGSGAK
jgi:exopolysaccharide biosynthesis polyprenyl glycosylphosphotransferase